MTGLTQAEVVIPLLGNSSLKSRKPDAETKRQLASRKLDIRGEDTSSP